MPSAFDSLLGGGTTTVQKKRKSAFDVLIESAPKAVNKFGQDVSGHYLNPLNPQNQLNQPLPEVRSGFGGFIDSLKTTTKKLFKEDFPGAFKDTFQVPIEIYKGFVDPSEIEQKIEKQAFKGTPPILREAGIGILRGLTPLVEGFGTILGEDILAQRELAQQAAISEPTRVGKQVQSSVSENLVTHKLTPDEILNVAFNSVQVGLLIAPFVTGLVKSGTLNLADVISKNSKVPISKADLVAITTSSSDAQAISRVGRIKFGAYREATRSNIVRQSLKQGYVKLAEKEPNIFANILRNAATRPVSEIANFARPYGKPVVTPDVGILPERIPFRDAAKTDPTILKKYEPIVEKEIVDYQLKPEFTRPATVVPRAADDLTTSIQKAKASGQSFDEWVKTAQGSATQYGDHIPSLRTKGLEGYENITKLGVEPDKTVTIYRGIDDIKGNLPREINDGDFVTTDFDSALSYAGSANDVVSMRVKAKDLYVSEPKDFKAEPFYTGAEYVYTKQGGEPLTRSQLKAKWDGVGTEIPAEGQTPSKIAKSIEQKAIEQKLTEGFEGIAGYDKITIKDQEERAANLINSNLDQARAIIRGEQSLPGDLNGVALIKEMEGYIKLNPNGELAQELANSPLISETSVAGQTLRLAAERTPDSATAKFQEIKKARLEKSQKITSPEVKQVIKSAKTETEKVNLSKEDLQWERFLQDITC